MDFIVGNPPWVNLSGFDSDDYKMQLKTLAEEQQILFRIESKNTEICSIFFFRCRELYLVKNGIIFFVVPASILNGRQHTYFRYFSGFKDIEVWKFDKDIFRIHSICLYARNTNIETESLCSIKMRLRLKCLNFAINSTNSTNSTTKEFIFSMKKVTTLIPFFIKPEESSNFVEIGRYNSESEAAHLQNINPEKCYYYKLVIGGIRIVPRRWLVVKNRPPFEDNVNISPDLKQQAKETWKSPPYDEWIVEKKSVKPFLKSQFLIPFNFIKVQYAFLPITYPIIKLKNKNSHDFFNESLMQLKSKSLFNFLDIEFKKLLKRSASMKSLSNNISYNRRLKPSTFIVSGNYSYLVVHNSIGSIVKAAIITEPFLIDNSLYFYPTNNINEAYYLLGILNSTIMTQFLEMIGSTGSRGSLRNIHKNPYNFPIEKFNDSEDHLNIANLSKSLEQISEKFIANHLGIDAIKLHTNLMESLNGIKEKVKIRTIQKNLLSNIVFSKVKKELNQSIIKSLSKNQKK